MQQKMIRNRIQVHFGALCVRSSFYFRFCIQLEVRIIEQIELSSSTPQEYNKEVWFHLLDSWTTSARQ